MDEQIATLQVKLKERQEKCHSLETGMQGVKDMANSDAVSFDGRGQNIVVNPSQSWLH